MDCNQIILIGIIDHHPHKSAVFFHTDERWKRLQISGILTFKNDRGLRETAAALPLDRLLVETDAPLLAPQGFRGRRNEPIHVGLVGETLAAVQGVPVEQVAETTTQNARRLFRLDS